jgi:hypothetical protein
VFEDAFDGGEFGVRAEHVGRRRQHGDEFGDQLAHGAARRLAVAIGLDLGGCIAGACDDSDRGPGVVGKGDTHGGPDPARRSVSVWPIRRIEGVATLVATPSTIMRWRN